MKAVNHLIEQPTMDATVVICSSYKHPIANNVLNRPLWPGEADWEVIVQVIYDVIEEEYNDGSRSSFGSYG